jgi:hypothetical protein
MKKIYLTPECETIKINHLTVLSSSPDPDTTDPVHVIDDPDDDDLDW